MKFSLVLFLFISVQLFSFANKSEYFQDKLKRNLNQNIQLCFRNQNKYLFMNEHEKFNYNLRKMPFLTETFFLYDMAEFFPWEFYEKYVSNRILLYSFHGYVDFSLNLKKYDSQLLQFSIPFEKVDFLNLFKSKNE